MTTASSTFQLAQKARLRRSWLVLAAFFLFAVFAACASVMTGAAPIPSADIIRTLFFLSPDTSSGYTQTVILNLRLPRMVLGLSVGAALGVAGAVLQGFLRNPLADPGLIGVSSGAALAAAGTVVLDGVFLPGLMENFGGLALPLSAFLGGLAAVFFVYRFAQSNGRLDGLTLILAGIALNALCGALIGALSYIGDDHQLRFLTLWMMGSLGSADWTMALFSGGLCLISAFALCSLARPLNALALGEVEAEHLGIAVQNVKHHILIFTALGVGAAAAGCGMVGFVGLVAPHLTRLMTGPDHRYVLPGAALMGAGLLTAADVTARLVIPPAEIPLGVILGLVGAPFFLWLLSRARKSLYSL